MRQIALNVMQLYLEDLTPGRVFQSETVTLTPAMITEFAAQFDPQPFHLDPSAASLFNGLAASGWHTASLTMRLFVDSVPMADGLIGGRIDSLQWPRPVRPGDTLQATTEVLETRESDSHPERGWVKFRVTTRNQLGEPVQILISNVVAWKRTRPGNGH